MSRRTKKHRRHDSGMVIQRCKANTSFDIVAHRLRLGECHTRLRRFLAPAPGKDIAHSPSLASAQPSEEKWKVIFSGDPAWRDDHLRESHSVQPATLWCSRPGCSYRRRDACTTNRRVIRESWLTGPAGLQHSQERDQVFLF